MIWSINNYTYTIMLSYGASERYGFFYLNVKPGGIISRLSFDYDDAFTSSIRRVPKLMLEMFEWLKPLQVSI